KERSDKMYKYPNTDIWNGRIDDSTDEKSFRFHQVVSCERVESLSNQKNNTVLIGFESDEGVRRNKGRTGAAQAPDKIKSALAKLPYINNQNKVIDVGN